MFARSVFTVTLAGVLLCSTTAKRATRPQTLFPYYTPQHFIPLLKQIPYTKSCPKDLYNCGILNGGNCHKASNAVYYASTNFADAFANCPNTYLAKITFKDGKDDIDIDNMAWVKAYFSCTNNKWEYCRDGACRPVRHFACYKKT